MHVCVPMCIQNMIEQFDNGSLEDYINDPKSEANFAKDKNFFTTKRELIFIKKFKYVKRWS